jgi:8-oxo-dGTP diphosphatase
MYTYKYPRPSLTVDIAVFREKDNQHEVLLINRKRNPFAGMWALPGGFVDMDETVETAAKRELYEETNVSGVVLKQFHVFSEIDRDPRGRTVSVVFIGFVKEARKIKAKDDAAEASWFKLSKLPDLAFDHAKIIQMIKEKKLKRS